MTFELLRSWINESYRETLEMIHPGKDIDQAIKEAYGHLASDERRLQTATASDFKRLVNSWLSTQRIKINGQSLAEKKAQDRKNKLDL